MKTAQNTLRVSHLTYIRVMDAVIEEVAGLNPAEAVEIIKAVTSYLHSAEGAEAGDNEILSRYFALIDRAALRSARARQAALNRRKANVLPAETPAEAPAETSAEVPNETTAKTPAETLAEIPTETSTEVSDETSTEVSDETPAENSAAKIQHSKSKIQNSPNPSPRPRIKIKHKSLSASRRRRARK